MLIVWMSRAFTAVNYSQSIIEPEKVSITFGPLVRSQLWKDHQGKSWNHQSRWARQLQTIESVGSQDNGNIS